jgi:hypothetical protein
MCKSLLINSDSFFKVVKECTEGNEATETLIVERLGSGSDEEPNTDIPF